MYNKTACESCPAGTPARTEKIPMSIQSNGSTLEVETERVVCTGCGALLYDEEADQKALNDLRHAASKQSTLTGEQIRAVREGFAAADGVAISRETFARLLGVSASAVKKAETEERKLNDELHALYVKLRQRPEFIRHVYALREGELTAEERKLCEKRLVLFLYRSPGELAMEAVQEQYRHLSNTKQTGYTGLSLPKLREMISVLCARGASPYRMASLLWLADALCFAKETVGMSGLAYTPDGSGMAPYQYLMLLGALQAADVIRIDGQVDSMRIVPLPVVVEPDDLVLLAHEYVVLHDVVHQTQYLSDVQLRDLLITRKWPEQSEPLSYREFRRYIPVL